MIANSIGPVVVVDSIKPCIPMITSAGSINGSRSCTYGGGCGIAMIQSDHVTEWIAFADPRRNMVDTVLYFEGDKLIRVRAINPNGATKRIGRVCHRRTFEGIQPDLFLPIPTFVVGLVTKATAAFGRNSGVG